MAIKRKILSYADFKKGKNSLENPDKHIIKESAESDDVLDEIVELASDKVDKWIRGSSEEFEKSDDRNDFVDNAIDDFFERYYSDDSKMLKYFNENRETVVAEVTKKIEKDMGLLKESAEVSEEISDSAKDFISKKIKKLVGEGRPSKQAQAMAYSYARKSGYKIPVKESFDELMGQEPIKIFESIVESYPEMEVADVKDLVVYLSQLKGESLTEKELKEMEAEVAKGNVYKVFDKDKNGAMVYSAARFDGEDKKGLKFALINRPTESYVWITKDDMKHFVFTPSSYKPKE